MITWRMGATLGLSLALACGCDVYDPVKLRTESGQQGAAGDGPGRDDAGADDGGGAGGPDSGSECTGEQPTCARPNALTVCADGRCLLVECEAPWVDCDGEAENGCETTLESLAHCGLCNARCALPNATTACVAGRCEFVECAESYGDCDADLGNGCETPLVTLSHCGGCGQPCTPFEHAAPGCFEGVCGIGQCVGPYGDCDGERENGCEERLRSVAHCAACGEVCEPPRATGDCESGTCVIASCDPGLVDCNGRISDGCEVDLVSAENCGVCGFPCELPPHAAAVACVSGDPARCAVDHACAPGDTGCDPEAPDTGCEPGFADCDGRGHNGCETRLGTLLDCGGCGDACAVPNAVSACVQGACEVEGCEPGFDRCSGGDCAPLAGDPRHCGVCERECAGETPNCHGGECTAASCEPGVADCNADAEDGCETALDTVANCGMCNHACEALPNAVPACADGRCEVGACEPGFADCDGAAHNGCEVDVRTLDACGACGQLCNIPFAEESCTNGRCELIECEPGRADCNGEQVDGCEASTALPAHCGGCGNDCAALPNVLRAACTEGECDFICEAGFGDCDADAATGCEADLESARHCGGCGKDCTALPNVVSATCNGTQCDDLECEPGFSNCDGLTSNGCERPIDTLSDCGACNVPCAPAHARAECRAGRCRVSECDPGYGNCNGAHADGCEVSLAEPSDCGSCGTDCGSGACVNGACTCADGLSCADDASCCDGVCVDTNSACLPWPCLPGTRRPQQNCGGCGEVCSLFCCGPLPD